jgi:hypothetical protein
MIDPFDNITADDGMAMEIFCGAVADEDTDTDTDNT